MSKTIKQSLVILIVLLVISVGVAIVTLLQKQAVEKQNEALNGQISEYETKERTLSKKVKDLETDVKNARADLDQKSRDIESTKGRLEETQRNYDRLTSDLNNVRQEKSDIDSKLQNIRRERDDLMKQIADLKNRPPAEKVVEKVVYRDRPVENNEGEAAVQQQNAQPQMAAPAIVVENKGNEEYWAGVMREKAALSLELDKVRKELNGLKLKIVDLNKASSDYEIEVGRLKNEKEEIARKIKYGDDLADSLSVELARARNDQKMSADRADKVEQENQALRTDIRQLTTTKVALEKSIARLTDEKSVIEKKLVETENIIQNRIDEIWKIKKDIDTRFDARGMNASSEVELPAIVVNAGSAAPSRAAQAAPQVKRAGTVVSVNEDNNFVIVDMGEKAGIKVGDAFKVYRNGSLIGSVSVIQVRADISAADIKQKTTPFKPGDTVK